MQTSQHCKPFQRKLILLGGWRTGHKHLAFDSANISAWAVLCNSPPEVPPGSQKIPDPQQETCQLLIRLLILFASGGEREVRS